MIGWRETGVVALALVSGVATAQEAGTAPQPPGSMAAGQQVGGAANDAGLLPTPMVGGAGAPGQGSGGGSGNSGKGQQPQKPVTRPLTPAELIELRHRMVGGAADAILAPADIAAIKNRVWDAQGAQSQPWPNGEPPTPRARIIKVDKIAAMSAPEQLYLAYGVVSPITFVDAKSRPWPISGVSYDPRLFAQDGAGCGAQVQAQASAAASNGGGASGQDRPTTINLMPCKFNTWGNITIQLEGVAYPLAFMIRSGGQDRFVDVPITISVVGNSPLPPTITATTPGASSAPKMSSKRGHVSRGPGDPIPDKYLNAFADGVPPKGAVRLSVDNDLITAWSFNGRLYVRGKVTLLNPPYDATAEASEGVSIWRVPDLVTRVLVSDAAGRESGVAIAY